MAIIDANPKTLAPALKTAKPGDTVGLAPGEYRSARIVGATDLTLVGADPKDRPRLVGGVVVNKANGLHLSGLAFELGPIETASAALLAVNGSTGVAVTDCDFLGYEREDGSRFGRGCVVSGVSGLTITGNRFSRMSRGAVIAGSNDVNFSENDLFDLGVDGLNLGQVNDVRVIGNRIVGFSPRPGDHPDGIQIMTTAAGAASEDVLIEGNLVVCGVTGRAQGIFVKAENPAVRHRNIRVVDNVLCNAGYNAISVGSTDDAVITGNTCLFMPTPDAKSSWIRTERTAGQMSGNAAMGYIAPEGMSRSDDRTIPAATAGQIAEAIAEWRTKWRPEPVVPRPEPEVIEIALKPGQRLVVTAAA